VLTARLAEERRAGAREHERSAGAIAALPAGHHVLEGLLRRVHGAVEVDAQHALPLLVAHVEEAGRPPPDAGVDEARVDAPELADGLGHRRDDRLLVADVADDRVHVAADGGQLLDRGVVLGRVGAPDGDRRAALGQPLGVAEADAAVAAGDQPDVAGEIEEPAHARRR
jgi:hypothetical protein